MNNKHIGAILLLLLTFTLSSNAKVTSVPTSHKETKSCKGIYYALPQNSIKLRITTEHIWRLQGPYFRYAGRYLGEESIISENSDKWSIKSIEISTSTSADPTQIYQLEAGKRSVANLLLLNENNLIECINGTLPEAEGDKDIPSQKYNQQTPSLQFDRSALGEDVLIALSTAKMAELSAKQIYRIRENRASLVTGDLDFPADGASFKLMLDEMNRMEQSLLELFIGKEVTLTYTTEITYTPTDDKNEVLFRFSEENGIVDKDDLSGIPYYIDIKVNKLDLNLNQRQKKGAIAYRQPADVDVKIYNNEECFINTTTQISQLGDILWLPKKLLNKRSSIQFDPVTGQLQQIKEK